MGPWKKLWAKHRWLEALFERREWSFAARWSRRGLLRARSFHAQYWRLARHAENDSLVFFQVGRFIEFYGPQRLLASRILGLRAACIDRVRFALAAGFPKSLCEIYLLRAIRQGVIVVVVREETARQSRIVATRLPSNLLLPFGSLLE
jgi:DNA mismatch repair ATPase MutS